MVEMVACEQCGHTRPARIVDGELRPFRSTCPKCGCTEYERLST